MPLWKVATAPEDLDASADALVEASDENLMPLFPTKSGSLAKAGIKADAGEEKEKSPTAPFLVEAEMPVDMNKNTNWFSYPGIWSMYFIIVMLTWLLILATAGCSIADAWVIVNCVHAVVTFYLFHWVKGSPFAAEDQGGYDNLTWWEQIDSGRQLTRNRKFLTLVPVVMFVVVSVATRNSPHSSFLLFLNTAIVFTLVIAKLPLLHKIRILGING